MARYQVQTRQISTGAWMGAGTEGTEVTWAAACKGEGFARWRDAEQAAKDQALENFTCTRVLDTRTGLPFGESGDVAEFSRMQEVARKAGLLAA